MPKLNSSVKGKDIWSEITLKQLVAAIVSLGDRVNQLDEETWRLNPTTTLSTSLWAQVIEKLNIDHTEKKRHCLYNIWHLKRHDIRKLVKKELNEKNKKIINANDGNTNGIDEVSVLEEKNKLYLLPDPSLPLSERAKTRAKRVHIDKGDDNELSTDSETSFILTPIEWKTAFSRSRKQLNDGWTNIFSDKLHSCGIKCSVRFFRTHIKEGKRKGGCEYLWCRAECTGEYCKRSYLIKLKDQVDLNTSPIFRVKISGKENHDAENETMGRQLCGEERYRVGERANKIGSLAVFRERVQAADESSLAAGNHTRCETIEVLKKAAADYRKKHQIDENIFTACRIVASAYRKADVTSTTMKGYVQVMGEMPFRTHLFSQSQIELYTNYCKKEEYSYLHIDATGGILKHVSDQNQILLYAMIFKDGTDSINTVPLAHALLGDHTVPSISYFLGNVAHEISEVKSRLIRPSFFVIDFSASLMNSILQVFNEENIKSHLNQCWNVLKRNYNTCQLRQLSFIHLCCAHVIKAIARSLNAARIDKKIRRGVLHVFSLILCGNNLEHLYDILGIVMNIFGDPNEQNANEKFEEMLSLELDIDEQTVQLLSDRKKILKEAKKENEDLRLVDEYFRSNIPIIHQSPFNIEAIRRYPDLKTLIINKSKYDKIVNPLFSPALIRIFYRWWAYLPLWTGLLWKFKERYSNSLQTNASVILNPVRHSNALIESYFRTLKQSTLENKINTRPENVILELYRSIQVQLKALKYEITLSSKGRKRKKDRNGEWSKKGIGKKCRNLYGKAIDAFALNNGLSKMKDVQSNKVTKESSDEKTASSAPSSDQSSISSDVLNDKISSKEPSVSSNNSSRASSPKPVAVVSNKCSNNDQVNSDKSIPDDRRSKPRVKFDFGNDDPNDNVFSVFDTIECGDFQQTLTTDQPSHHSEVLIDGHLMRWPEFGIKKAIFNGRYYTLDYTCPTDSALFALYFIYRTDINIYEELNNASSTSIYSTLVKVFRTVEKEGWNTARLSWLDAHGILENFARKRSLFGSLDAQVFDFLKHEQHYSYQIECSRAQCKKRKRKHGNIELCLFTHEDYIRAFCKESIDICDVEMAKLDEMTTEEALEYNYIKSPLRVITEQTDTDEQVWMCHAVTHTSVAAFTHDYPPIIITNVRHIPKRSEKGSSDGFPQLLDLKRVIKINTVEYKLCAVIHHTYVPVEHFTATLISSDGQLYLYDDLSNQFYNSFKLISHNNKHLTTTTVTATIITTTTSIILNTTVKQIIEQAQMVENKLNQYVRAFEIIAMAVVGAITTIWPIVCFSIKFYKNNCQCKISWFKIKSPSEYRRRHDLQNQGEIALQHITQQLQTSSVYSVA